MEQSTNQASAQQVLLAKKMLSLEHLFKGGVNTFYWIAGFSLVNTMIHLGGGKMTFVIGLGITQIIDAIAQDLIENHGGSAGMVHLFSLVMDVCIAGIFILCGYFGLKRHKKTILFGIIIYLLDASIFILSGGWYSGLFHGLMLVSLIRGYWAIGELQKLEEGFATGGIASVQGMIQPAVSQVSPEEKKKRQRMTSILILSIFGVLIMFCVLSNILWK